MKSLFIILSLSLIIFSQQTDSLAIDAKVSEVTAVSNVACTIVFTFTSDSAGTKINIGKIAGLVLAKSSDATSTTPLTYTLESAKEITASTPVEFACAAGTLVEGKYKKLKLMPHLKSLLIQLVTQMFLLHLLSLVLMKLLLKLLVEVMEKMVANS